MLNSRERRKYTFTSRENSVRGMATNAQTYPMSFNNHFTNNITNGTSAIEKHYYLLYTLACACICVVLRVVEADGGVSVQYLNGLWAVTSKEIPAQV